MGKSKKKGPQKQSRRKRGGQPRRPQSGDTTHISDGISFDCPHCGLRVTMGYDQHGNPVGAHLQPVCSVFMDLELDEYLKWTRLKLEGTTDA